MNDPIYLSLVQSTLKSVKIWLDFILFFGKMTWFYLCNKKEVNDVFTLGDVTSVMYG